MEKRSPEIADCKSRSNLKMINKGMDFIISTQAIQKFSLNLEAQAVSIETAHKKRDWDTILKICHRLRGSAPLFGFNDVAEVCSRLEESISEFNLCSVGNEIERLGKIVNSQAPKRAV